MALLELSKQREKFPELAPYLWNSFGTMAVLLQVRLAAVYHVYVMHCHHINILSPSFAGDHNDLSATSSTRA